MCGASRSPILRGMDGTTTAISLEMHLAGDSLTGTATTAAGVERPFCGWLGLIAAIDELLGDSAALPSIDAVLPTSDSQTTPTPARTAAERTAP
jgi:hypothetical protein